MALNITTTQETLVPGLTWEGNQVYHKLIEITSARTGDTIDLGIGNNRLKTVYNITSDLSNVYEINITTTNGGTQATYEVSNGQPVTANYTTGNQSGVIDGNNPQPILIDPTADSISFTNINSTDNNGNPISLDDYTASFNPLVGGTTIVAFNTFGVVNNLYSLDNSSLVFSYINNEGVLVLDDNGGYASFINLIVTVQYTKM